MAEQRSAICSTGLGSSNGRLNYLRYFNRRENKKDVAQLKTNIHSDNLAAVAYLRLQLVVVMLQVIAFLFQAFHFCPEKLELFLLKWKRKIYLLSVVWGTCVWKIFFIIYIMEKIFSHRSRL